MVDSQTEQNIKNAVFVTDVTISGFGSRVVLCLDYFPLDTGKTAQLTFNGCKDIQIASHEDPDPDPRADIIDLNLGEGNHQKPAIIYCDIFDVSILYKNFDFQKSW